jgi:hypothetical protein
VGASEAKFVSKLNNLFLGLPDECLKAPRSTVSIAEYSRNLFTESSTFLHYDFILCILRMVSDQKSLSVSTLLAKMS